MRPERIPLFPLEVVLFPGLPLPLHIFEPRYKAMIGDCLQSHAEFGVVLARPDGVAAVGCTAAIVEVLKTYPDGRMDLMTSGRAPFHMLELHEEKTYLEATVEYLKDEPDASAAVDSAELRALFAQCHRVLYGRPPQSAAAPPGVSPAFVVASELPLDLDYKQSLLELRSESERQESLREKMQKWLPELERMDRVRRKAGGNGHAQH